MKSKIISFLSSLGALFLGCFGGACGIACLAGGCCGSFALLGFIGLSGSSLGFIGKLTPIFLTLTIISLAYAFYVAYKPKKAECCESSNNTSSETNDCCAPKNKAGFLKSKTFVWTVAFACLIMWTYPYFAPIKYKNSSNCENVSADCCDVQSENLNLCCPQSTSQSNEECCSDFPEEFAKYVAIAQNVCCSNR